MDDIPFGSSLALRTNPVLDWLSGSADKASASTSKSLGFSSRSGGGLVNG